MNAATAVAPHLRLEPVLVTRLAWMDTDPASPGYSLEHSRVRFRSIDPSFSRRFGSFAHMATGIADVAVYDGRGNQPEALLPLSLVHHERLLIKREADPGVKRALPDGTLLVCHARLMQPHNHIVAVLCELSSVEGHAISVCEISEVSGRILAHTGAIRHLTYHEVH